MPKFHIDGLKIHIDGLLIWGNIRSLCSVTPTSLPHHLLTTLSHLHSSLHFVLFITLSSSIIIVSRERPHHPPVSLHHITLFIHIFTPLFIIHHIVFITNTLTSIHSSIHISIHISIHTLITLLFIQLSLQTMNKFINHCKPTNTLHITNNHYNIWF